MIEGRDNGRSSLPPGTLLREALQTLWDLKRSSVREVVDRLERKLGSMVPYSTAASALNKLCESGLATRVRIQGAREYLYSALVSREQLDKASTMEAVQTLLKEARNPREALSYLVEIVSQADGRLLEDLREAVAHKRQAANPKRKR
jgi:predicted transcriptional regulator